MQFCFFSKMASVLSHWTVIIPCNAQGQKPFDDALWSPLSRCPPHQRHSLLKTERKCIWERYLLITLLPVVVLTLDGDDRLSNVQKMFNFQQIACAYTHLSVPWKWQVWNGNCIELREHYDTNIAMQAENTSSQLYRSQYENMSNKQSRGSPLNQRITPDTCHAQKNRGIRPLSLTKHNLGY